MRRALAGFVAVLLLAGCGSSGHASTSTAPPGLSGGALLGDARAQLLDTTSVHIAGTLSSGGTSTTIDMDYATTGTGGTVDGVRIIGIGTTIWISASDAYWTKQFGSAASSLVKRIHGKWVEEDGTGPGYDTYSSVVERSLFVAQLFGDGSAAVSVGADKTVAGIPCHALITGDSTLYVAADDSRPIEITPTAGSGSTGTVTFDEYNAVTPATPPPLALTVPSDDLQF